MTFNKFYQDELTYLRELGREFSEAHPDNAHMLTGPEADPDVERLLEGFAFLSGRIREKLEDELPEITHGLASLLYPHYMLPIPSLSILEFEPVLAALRQSRRIPRGAEVASVPVEGTPCRFRTTQDVVLQPISIEQARIEPPAAPTRLRLRFKIWNQLRPGDLDLSRLQLHLHGDPALTYPLYLALRSHLTSARVVRGEGADAFRPLEVQAAGLTAETNGDAADPADSALLLYPERSHPGFRILQEYFAFPRRFLFVDLMGLDALDDLDPAADGFEVVFEFDRPLPDRLPVHDLIKLHCTPIVNVFEHEADPFKVDGDRTEYRLRPAGKNPAHYEIYDVAEVTTTRPGSAERATVPDFHTFSRTGGTPGLRSYVLRRHPSVIDARSDAYMAFVDTRGVDTFLGASTVSVRVLATNRRLPEALKVGDIRIATDGSPEFVTFRNLTVPTASVPAPLGADLHWRLLSHLALAQSSLGHRDTLLAVLGLYARNPNDNASARANRRRIEGINEVRATPVSELVRGAMARGSRIELQMREDHFSGEGDLYLFASVLSEFFAQYATLNSFTRLVVKEILKGEEHAWPRMVGRRPLI